MRVHYMFSDLFYLLIYRVAGYRRRIVRQNLTSAFPEKQEEEILRIERDTITGSAIIWWKPSS